MYSIFTIAEFVIFVLQFDMTEWIFIRFIVIWFNKYILYFFWISFIYMQKMFHLE